MANVLIIDDDLDVTHLLESQLQEQGHSVRVAHQGDEGFAKAMESVPDLIMLDVFLPDATGFQICTQIRKNSTTKTTPIIMMTGAARFPTQQLFGLERGANEYISKPFDMQEVDGLVKKYISSSKHAAAPFETFEPQHFNTEPVSAPAPAAVPAPAPAAAPAPSPARKNNSDNLLSLNSFLEQVVKETPAPAPAPEPVQEPEPMPVDVEIHVPSLEQSNGHRDAFVPPVVGVKDRFVDFGMEIYALTTRMCSTHAETYLADQLLRTSLAVGARIHETKSAETKDEYMGLLRKAQKELQETAYWLHLTKKAGLLETLNKVGLDKTCQSLLTMLLDFIHKQKQR